MNLNDLRIAAIVPCYNEEIAVATVVNDLRAALPTAEIYVYDNNSTDRTAEIAAQAGAIVRREPRKGKGNVVRRAFADIEADVYLMIDGDDTYDASAAPRLVRTLLENQLDHVVGARVQKSETAYRPGHAVGNKFLTGVVRSLYGNSFTDMLSGYRVFSRRYVKSFPALSQEFEIETELTIHTLHVRVPAEEVGVDFNDRAEGSESKLRTYRDGWRILGWIGRVTRHERPVLFHGAFAALLAIVSLVLAAPVILEFSRTGLVPRFPTAILAAAIMTIAGLVLAVGYVLDSIRHSRVENARLAYLQFPAPQWLGLTDEKS